MSDELHAERAINWSAGTTYAARYMRELQAGLQGRINNLVAGRHQRTILVTRQNCFT